MVTIGVILCRSNDGTASFNPHQCREGFHRLKESSACLNEQTSRRTFGEQVDGILRPSVADLRNRALTEKAN
jgi:hypothetical protein